MHIWFIHTVSLYPDIPSDVSMHGFDNNHGDHKILSVGSSSDNMAEFMVGQTVKLECAANIGTYKNSAQIRFRKSNLVLGPIGGINMAPFPTFGAPDQVTEDPTSADQCQWQLKSHVFYNMTPQDATRPDNNPLKFDCYVDINSINYETPDKDRPDFYIRVSKLLVYISMM